MIPQRLIADLRRAVVEAVELRQHNHHRLKDVVCAIVDVLKANGEPPERVLTTVRRLIRDVPESGDYPAIGDSIVAWCIDRYFHARESP